MSDMLPPPEDNFDFSDMEKQLADIQMPDVTSVSVLDDAMLLKRYRDLTEELKDRKEALRPTTQVGRDLHSQRAAMLVELKRRRIM